MPKLIHISKRQECGEIIECGEGSFGKVFVGLGWFGQFWQVSAGGRVCGESVGQMGGGRLESVGRVVWGERRGGRRPEGVGRVKWGERRPESVGRVVWGVCEERVCGERREERLEAREYEEMGREEGGEARGQRVWGE